jgi:tRNA-specific 2-thiouridylase
MGPNAPRASTRHTVSSTPTAKAESHEIFIVPDGNHAGFVAAAALRKGRPVPERGVIATADGTVVGHHDGVHRFTIGQHRGLGNLTSRDRLFVVGLEPATGTVVVGPRDAALSTDLAIRDVRWLGPVPGGPFAARVQVRHRGAALAATVTPAGASAAVRFSDESTVAAPGQAAVIYDGDRVVGGGWVARAADRATLRAASLEA